MPDTAEVRNEYSQDYRGFFVAGAVGGYNKDGYLVIDLWNDRPGFPDAYQAEAVDGKVTIDVSKQPPITVREFQTRLYMSVTFAKSLRDFLVRQIKAATKDPDA